MDNLKIFNQENACLNMREECSFIRLPERNVDTLDKTPHDTCKNRQRYYLSCIPCVYHTTRYHLMQV